MVANFKAGQRVRYCYDDPDNEYFSNSDAEEIRNCLIENDVDFDGLGVVLESSNEFYVCVGFDDPPKCLHMHSGNSDLTRKSDSITYRGRVWYCDPELLIPVSRFSSPEEEEQISAQFNSFFD